MTGKEIIINGVNVRGCDCYIKEQLIPNNLKGGYHHYKQLCESGMNSCEHYTFYCEDNPNCYYKQLKRLEQENKQLEALYETYKELEEAHDKIQGAYQDDHCDLLKYKLTLQEIKAIAEVGQDKYHNGLIIAKPILDLITKAESEV